jgi:hypothetical protein
MHIVEEGHEPGRYDFTRVGSCRGFHPNHGELERKSMGSTIWRRGDRPCHQVQPDIALTQQDCHVPKLGTAARAILLVQFLFVGDHLGMAVSLPYTF